MILVKYNFLFNQKSFAICSPPAEGCSPGMFAVKISKSQFSLFKDVFSFFFVFYLNISHSRCNQQNIYCGNKKIHQKLILIPSLSPPASFQLCQRQLTAGMLEQIFYIAALHNDPPDFPLHLIRTIWYLSNLPDFFICS